MNERIRELLLNPPAYKEGEYYWVRIDIEQWFICIKEHFGVEE
jgi:hypothetical protein